MPFYISLRGKSQGICGTIQLPFSEPAARVVVHLCSIRRRRFLLPLSLPRPSRPPSLSLSALSSLFTSSSCCFAPLIFLPSGRTDERTRPHRKIGPQIIRLAVAVHLVGCLVGRLGGRRHLRPPRQAIDDAHLLNRLLNLAPRENERRKRVADICDTEGRTSSNFPELGQEHPSIYATYSLYRCSRLG